MISEVEGDVVARGSRPNDNNLLSSIFLCGRVLEGVDDLSLKVFLRAATNQPGVREHEEDWEKGPAWVI